MKSSDESLELSVVKALKGLLCSLSGQAQITRYFQFLDAFEVVNVFKFLCFQARCSICSRGGRKNEYFLHLQGMPLVAKLV